ncbi:YiiX/YebB-like N1pC/P60 family cysteine hydrolase [Bdellovibrio sp. HCB288]|uniref:YiiX/YebB-like N1pC/P60 family cysteine hydrolase n=1 Tax=Bdellovibrio sp. HCB288 TaxID=3394355 RepID=UPI0039B5D44C
MRFSLVSLCLVPLAFAACKSQQEVTERVPAAASYVDPQYYDYQTLFAEALTFRAKALQFAQEKKLNESSDVSFSRSEGEWVRKMGADYLVTRKKLLDYTLPVASNFASPNQVKLTPYLGTKNEVKERVRPKDVWERYQVLSIDPKDPQGEKEIFKTQMALASALILMDNFLVAIQPYNNIDSIRYVLNYDVEQKKALQKVADSYTNRERRDQIRSAIEFVDGVMAWRRAQGVTTSPEESNLYGMIQSSIWYVAVKNNKESSNFEDAVANLWGRLTSRGKRGARVVSYGVSMGFGNMVGLVETRKGYLYNMSLNEKNKLIAEMKPLDILMEKTPFRLTDKMIPGHYGHVAIWLGTEQQLKDLKVWDQIPSKVQAKIRSGHRIVEALRPGVEINSLDHFLNIDDFLVVRDNRSNITDEYRRKAILQAVAQIGKEYDFNFDVHTHTRIVCSEIAYVVFDDVKWPLANTLMRYTISPDNVAQLAVGNQRMFDPVIMYYGGRRVYKDLPHSLELLLKADDASYAEFSRFQGI